MRAAVSGPTPAPEAEPTILLTEVVAAPRRGLPPLPRPARRACRVCGRSHRPVWSGVCAWCGADEDDLR